ncbi:hypothetical protein HZX00_001937 [Salmonella enterica]|nr:hypothetical protein [Salmonella enterica]EGF6146391.1 hypothetical protein [Salmonella enterica]EHE6023073.1 hypothetical protein [Salmonella enterica]
MQVFPAPAGINRPVWSEMARFNCVPRASGDKPGNEGFRNIDAACSPRQRG